MALLIVINQESKSSGQAASASLPASVVITRVEAGQVNIQIAPLVYALIVLFLEEMAKGAGKSFGSALGSWLAERMGLTSSAVTAKDIKKMLDDFAQQIAAEMRAQFYQAKYEAAHEQLAAATLMFGELMRASRPTDAEISDCNTQVTLAYEKVQGLGYPAMASFSRAASMSMTMGIYMWERYSHDPKRKASALDRIDASLKALSELVSNAELAYASRVTGPNQVKVKIPVPDGRSGGGGRGGVSDPANVQPSDTLQPMSEENVEAYQVTIDTAVTTRFFYDPPWAHPHTGWKDYKDIHEQSLAEVQALATSAREKFERDFNENFKSVLIASQSEASKAKATLTRRG